jgi:26S proteasome regulatory subunit N2
MATAVLSTTAKAKAREKAKDKDKDKGKDKDKAGPAADGEPSKSADAMDAAPPADRPERADEAAEKGGAPDAGADKKKPSRPEPSTETLENPARVLPAQAPYVTLDEKSRYEPIKRVRARVSPPAALSPSPL